MYPSSRILDFSCGGSRGGWVTEAIRAFATREDSVPAIGVCGQIA